jgi:methionyl aminopeptidase
MNTHKILQAGKIASDSKKYSKSIIKKNIPLLEIAEKIEAKIIEFGGKPAFPVNISIDNVAAHYTPFYDDKTLAHGLLKVDLGAQVDGWISDTAFSIDLENSDENKKLIEASEKALENAIKNFKKDKTINSVGAEIAETIESFGFSPIINLGGHGLEKEDFHAKPFIPNFDNRKNILITESLYAIEPFVTTGSGKVHEGNPSGIYQLISEKNIRNPAARELLLFIINEYKKFPFCSRWLVKKFGTKILISLKQLEANGNLHQFPQLIETKNAKVSQSEDTILLTAKEIIVTTD